MYELEDQELPFIYYCPELITSSGVWHCDVTDCDGEHHYYIPLVS